MSLEYNILWLDDKKEEIEQIYNWKTKLIEYIKNELFFNPLIDLCESSDEALKLIDSKRYDVIFTDYNLLDGELGSDFIKKVRKKNKQCEVLFYSANKDIKEISGSLIISNSDPINRVSFYTLPKNKSDFYATIKRFINSSVEKLNTLSAIRGIVMAEVSDLDNKMIEVIKKYYVGNSSNDKGKKLLERIILKREENIKEKLIVEDCENTCTHKWRKSNIKIDDILNDFEFDSSQKARAINYIIKDIDYSYKPNGKNYFEDYNKEIIKTRNLLAHCLTINKNSEEYLMDKNGNKIEFDTKVVRNSIIRFQEILNDLLDKC